MGENKREVETDEVDLLLDEIPKATSGNPHYEEFQPKAVLIDSCKGPYSEKFPKNRSPQQRKMASVNGVQNSLAKTAQANEPKLPDEQSLTSAFAELNVSDGLGSQYAKGLGMHRLNADTKVRNSGFDGISGARVAQENPDVCWVDPLGLKSHRVGGSYQQIDNSTGSISMTNDGVQFVPNLPVHALDTPTANQQQYLMNPQSLLPYLRLPHIDQSQAAWRNIEEENFYKLYQQSLYYQQLLNHHFEAQHPVQSNITLGPKRQQPPYEIPVSQCLERPDQEAFLHGYGLARCLKPQSLILSPSDARAVQALDRISQQGSAAQNMTRSNGINSLRSVKLGAVDDTINHVSQNGRGTSNGQFYPSLCGTNNSKCFQEDRLNYFRSCDSRLLPFKYNNCEDEVSNRTHLMAKDQHGCRFLQRKISEGGPKDVEKVFIEIIDHIVELMTDPFGNYLVQKLLEVCNEDQQTRILQVITRNSGDLIRISCDMHG
ncbi:hypothetical protein CRG98_018248 [Punica granatum]|uniref:PUM-HD domain-containing protein n=1 Tax=Punica granatum TaxID=22663 RepID=A0A2I0K0X5_PUNGR|nr:hypothetical protein CRG98_018248 [Punica granatum]